MDVSNNLRELQQCVYSPAIVLSFLDLQLLSHSSAALQEKFPDIPGLLCFREVPSLVEAFTKLD